MGWQEPTTEGPLTEWERSDGEATVRIRELPDGSYAVRLDRMYDAPGGSEYRREERPDREAAESLAAAWRDSYDVPESED
ncbi:MAG: hypothetical protein ABEJ79_09590 [Halolamina sp.]